MRIDAVTTETLSEHAKGRDDRLADIAGVVARAPAQPVGAGEEQPASDPPVEVERVRALRAGPREASRHLHVPRARPVPGAPLAHDAVATALDPAQDAVDPEGDGRHLGELEADRGALVPVEEPGQDAQEAQ